MHRFKTVIYITAERACRVWHRLSAATVRLLKRCMRPFATVGIRCHHPQQCCPFGTGWRQPLLYEHLSSYEVLDMLRRSYTELTRLVRFQVLTRELQPRIPAGCIAEIRLFYAGRQVSRAYLSMIAIRRGEILTVYWLLVPQPGFGLLLAPGDRCPDGIHT